MAEEQSASSFISKLIDEGITAQAFLESTFDHDFILLAEFCEMEGPKPIFTIPSVFNSTFNLNTFAVRIMSVDCVSIMQTTDFSHFKVAGDIQVVLTELSEGAVAYVHHFVLYDICARGFVRPFCLALVMKNHAELLAIYEKLSIMFSLVSELFHFGNALSFINDLVLRIEHLLHLKKVLSEKYCDIFVDDQMLTESQKKGITNKALDEAMFQLHELVNKFKLYVESSSFDDHRALFDHRYQQIMDKLESSGLLRREYDTAQIGGKRSDTIEAAKEETEDGILFTARPSHQVPSDVISSILGKKYDKRLRHLDELCDTTNSIALDVLRYSLHVFTSKNTTLFNPFTVEASKAEQATKFIIGTTEFPVLACVPNQFECCVTSSPSQISSVKMFLRHFLNLHSKTATKVEECSRLDEADGGIGGKLVEDLSSSFLSLLKYTSISLPTVSASSLYSKVGSFVNIPSVYEEKNAVLSTGDQHNYSGASENSSDSYKDALSYPESVGSSNNSSSEATSHRGGVTLSHSVSVMSNESHISISDGIKAMMKSTKVSLLKLRDRFSFLPHVIYSFFIGRPVIVVGKDSSNKAIASLVYGLANMLPNNPFFPKQICPWLLHKLTLRDLSKYGLIGISKSKDKHPVPMSLRVYVSIIDYEKDTFDAPVYRGEILTKLFDTSRNLSEKAFRRLVMQTWSEFIAEAYTRFTNSYTHELTQYTPHEGVGKSCTGVNCDKEILSYFIDTLRMQMLHAFLNGKEISGNLTANTIKLNNKKCETIQNIYRKRNAKSK